MLLNTFTSIQSPQFASMMGYLGISFTASRFMINREMKTCSWKLIVHENCIMQHPIRSNHCGTHREIIASNYTLLNDQNLSQSSSFLYSHS